MHIGSVSIGISSFLRPFGFIQGIKKLEPQRTQSYTETHGFPSCNSVSSVVKIFGLTERLLHIRGNDASTLSHSLRIFCAQRTGEIGVAAPKTLWFTRRHVPGV